MTNEQITHAARAICAAQADKQDNGDSQIYLSGGWDHIVLMRLVEEGIRKGMEAERAAVSDWFFKRNQRQLADSINRADHMKEQSK